MRRYPNFAWSGQNCKQAAERGLEVNIQNKCPLFLSLQTMLNLDKIKLNRK